VTCPSRTNTTTAFGAVTDAQLSIGKTAGGAEYVAAVSIKALARSLHTLVGTAIADLDTVPGNRPGLHHLHGPHRPVGRQLGRGRRHALRESTSSSPRSSPRAAASSEAYRLAGYRGGETNACRLASNDKVQARVAELQLAAAEKVELSVAGVLMELWRIATADPSRAGRIPGRLLPLLLGQGHRYQETQGERRGAWRSG
jgi:hypothetical protein